MYQTNFSRMVEEPLHEDLLILPVGHRAKIYTEFFVHGNGNPTARGLRRTFHYKSMFPSLRKPGGCSTPSSLSESEMYEGIVTD